jgi:hypothetical protein
MVGVEVTVGVFDAVAVTPNVGDAVGVDVFAGPLPVSITS